MRIDVLRPFELYLLDNTNGLRSISQGLKRSDTAPAWSPDGTRMAISSFSSPEGSALFVMNADSTEPRQIIAFTGNGMIYDLARRPGE